MISNYYNRKSFNRNFRNQDKTYSAITLNDSELFGLGKFYVKPIDVGSEYIITDDLKVYKLNLGWIKVKNNNSLKLEYRGNNFINKG